MNKIIASLNWAGKQPYFEYYRYIPWGITQKNVLKALTWLTSDRLKAGALKTTNFSGDEVKISFNGWNNGGMWFLIRLPLKIDYKTFEKDKYYWNTFFEDEANSIYRKIVNTDWRRKYEVYNK